MWLSLVSEMNPYVAEGKTGEALAANERRREPAGKAGGVRALIGVHTAGGLILAAAGRLDDAAKHFEQADRLGEDPWLPAAGKENSRSCSMQSRVRLAFALHEFVSARTQLEKSRLYLSSRNNSNHESAYYQTAGFLELGQMDYAEALELSARANPNNPYVW